MIRKSLFNSLFISMSIALCQLALPMAQAANASQSAIDQYNQGHYSQALALFQQISKSRPSDALSHYYMGLCYQRLNQIALAQQEYSWVNQHSAETSIRQNAQRALNQLTQYQSKRTYDSSTIASNQASPPPASYSAGRPKIIEFSATWCGPCKKFAPVFEEVKSNYRSRADFQSIDIDNESTKDLVSKYSVSSVPTIVFLNGQGKVMDVHQGTMTEIGFSSRIDQLLQGK